MELKIKYFSKDLKIKSRENVGLKSARTHYTESAETDSPGHFCFEGMDKGDEMA